MEEFMQVRQIDSMYSGHLERLFQQRVDLDRLWFMVKRGEWAKFVDQKEREVVLEYLERWQRECSESLNSYLTRMRDRIAEDEMQRIAADLQECPGFSGTGTGKAVLDGWSASVRMGQFHQPFEDELKSMTLGEWNFEKTRRTVLAVLRALWGQSRRRPLRDK